MKRVMILLTTTAAVACAALAAVAIAHTVRHATSVSIKVKTQGHKPDVFDGKVTSDTPACEAGRTVKVKMAGTTPTLAGKATSDASGDWTLQLTGDAQPGDYYAIAAKKVLRKNAHHLHVCKAGKSSSVTVK